jgi:hypothetical protein
VSRLVLIWKPWERGWFRHIPWYSVIFRHIPAFRVFTTPVFFPRIFNKLRIFSVPVFRNDAVPVFRCSVVPLFRFSWFY